MADLLDSLDNLALDAEANGIEAFMRELYPLMFGAAYDEANEDLPVDVAYDTTNPAIQRTIDRLATRVRGVSDTVRENIRNLIGTALEGEYDEGAGGVVIPSNAEIAARIRAAGITDSEYRSRMIARTETGTAFNLGHTYAYEDAGVSEVEVMDGEDDPECAQANGSVWSLEEARDNPLQHPNCVRAFAPRVGGE